MKPTDLTVGSLLAAFQSTDPVPGGGSASALAGAVGAALLVMVAGLPKPRAETEEDRARLAEAGSLCAGLSHDLAALIDRDSDAYEQVMLAYRRPKLTDAEKAARATAIQDALKEATAAPLNVMRSCGSALEQAVVVATIGNRSASSDVLVAIELLMAGLRGAKANVEINLGSVKDERYVEHVRADVVEFERGALHEAAAARARLQS